MSQRMSPNEPPESGTTEPEPMLDYLDPPRYVGPVTGDYRATNRAFQGIPSLAVSPGGRLWATWYAGVTPGEDANNYVVLGTSDDDGETWREVMAIDPDGPGPVRAFDPELWFAPDGRLWLFWAQGLETPKQTGASGVWSMTAEDGETADTAWSEPRRLCDGVMMCKPLALSTGEWGLPVSFWARRDAQSAALVISTDRGATWAERGACDVPADDRAYDEHLIVEQQDGTLRMWVRTRYGIGESVSRDRGATWSPLQRTGIPHPSSRVFITRLESGNLLLVKHGLMQEQTERTHLTAFLSSDDGGTWAGGLLLDERASVSYPDGQQAVDGTIYVTYDINRRAEREILFATFREDDVAAGEPVSDAVRLRQRISKGTGGREEKPAAEEEEKETTE